MKSHLVPSGPLAPETFRAFVREELGRRCARSPRYSLRAFAADLRLDHSSLSQLLRGKRRWSERAIREIGTRLGLDEERVEAFVRRERATAGAESSAVRIARSLTADALAVLSSFEHEAILELTHLEDFRPDVRWIARTLDLSADRVNVALQQLLRLGMLSMESADTWVDLTGNATTVHAPADLPTAVPAMGARDGGQALEYSCTTLAVDRARLPEALARVARFRSDLVDFLAHGERRDAVVQLEIRLLPLTRTEERNDDGTTGDAVAGDHEGA